MLPEFDMPMVIEKSHQVRRCQGLRHYERPHTSSIVFLHGKRSGCAKGEK